MSDSEDTTTPKQHSSDEDQPTIPSAPSTKQQTTTITTTTTANKKRALDLDTTKSYNKTVSGKLKFKGVEISSKYVILFYY